MTPPGARARLQACVTASRRARPRPRHDSICETFAVTVRRPPWPGMAGPSFVSGGPSAGYHTRRPLVMGVKDSPVITRRGRPIRARNSRQESHLMWLPGLGAWVGTDDHREPSTDVLRRVPPPAPFLTPAVTPGPVSRHGSVYVWRAFLRSQTGPLPSSGRLQTRKRLVRPSLRSPRPPFRCRTGAIAVPVCPSVGTPVTSSQRAVVSCC